MTARSPVSTTELPRTVPPGPAPDVTGEVWHALRAAATERAAERESAVHRTGSVRADLDRLALVVAEVAHQMLAVGDSRADPLLDGVRRTGMVLLDPVGEPLTDDWAELVEIAHSEPDGSVGRPTVREVWRPGLLEAASGRVVGRAVVALVVPAVPDPGQEAD